MCREIRISGARHLAVCILLVLGGAAGAAVAQESALDFASLPVDERTPTRSPEASRVLAPQPNDRGDLMSLHAASVLSWVCRDSTVQQKLNETTAGCYRSLWPLVDACTAMLLASAPAAQNRVADGRQDLLTFRASFRACLSAEYAARQESTGAFAGPSIEVGDPDPLASRMPSMPKSVP